MKVISLIIFICISVALNAQSKKEQILQLSKELDSLKQAFNNERAKLIQNETLIESQNSRLEHLDKENSRMDNQIRSLNQDLNAKTNQIKNLQKDLSTKTDSIRLIKQILLEKANNKNDAQPFEITYATLNKPAKASMENIDDWLEQFTLLNTHSINYTDGVQAYLPGDNGEMDYYAIPRVVTVNYHVYKEGINLTELLEHEGASYILFLPFLKAADVKKNLEKICRNMGGCIPPEDVNFNIEETHYGVLVSWGGGC